MPAVQGSLLFFLEARQFVDRNFGIIRRRYAATMPVKHNIIRQFHAVLLVG